MIGDDGATRWFESVSGPERNRDGKVSRVFATLLDITSLIEGQTALAAEKAKADEILASIGDGFYALDFSGASPISIRAPKKMLGRKPTEVIDRPFFDVFPMVEGTQVHANYKNVMDEDRAFKFEMISPIIKRWVAFSALSDPARAAFPSIFRTWSSKKSRKKPLVGARRPKPSAANLAKSKFLASASHDLRQPVQSLVLLQSLIERQVKDNPKAVATTQMMKTGPRRVEWPSHRHSGHLAP